MKQTWSVEKGKSTSQEGFKKYDEKGREKMMSTWSPSKYCLSKEGERKV